MSVFRSSSLLQHLPKFKFMCDIWHRCSKINFVVGRGWQLWYASKASLQLTARSLPKRTILATQPASSLNYPLHVSFWLVCVDCKSNKRVANFFVCQTAISGQATSVFVVAHHCDLFGKFLCAQHVFWMPWFCLCPPCTRTHKWSGRLSLVTQVSLSQDFFGHALVARTCVRLRCVLADKETQMIMSLKAKMQQNIPRSLLWIGFVWII